VAPEPLDKTSPETDHLVRVAVLEADEHIEIGVFARITARGRTDEDGEAYVPLSAQELAKLRKQWPPVGDVALFLKRERRLALSSSLSVQKVLHDTAAQCPLTDSELRGEQIELLHASIVHSGVSNKLWLRDAAHGTSSGCGERHGALEWGLINRVFDDGAFEDEPYALLERSRQGIGRGT